MRGRTRWLVGVAVALLALGAALVVVAINFNAFLESNRERLAAEVSRRLGRTMNVESVRLSLQRGLAAEVRGLRLADDPRFSQDDFLRVGRAHVVVRLLPALLGRYEVRHVELEAPEITIVRSADGLNVASLGRGSEPPDAVPEATVGRDAGAPAALLVSAMRVSDGTVRLVDRTTTPPTTLTLEDVSFSGSDLTFSDPIAIDATARLGEGEPNLAARGTVGPVATEPIPVDLVVTGDPLDVVALRRALPMLDGALADVVIEGPLATRAAITGTVSAPSLQVDVEASGATVGWADMVHKPAGVPARLSGRIAPTGDAIEVERATLRLADAELTATGRITLAPTRTMDFRVDGESMPLAGLAALAPALTLPVSGTTALHLTVKAPLDGTIPVVHGTVALADVAAGDPAAPFTVRDLSTTIRLQGDSAVLPPTRVTVAGLPTQVEGTLERFTAPIRFSARTAIESGALEKVPGNTAATGLLDAMVNVRGAGSDVESILQGLTGQGRITVTNGVLRGVNLAGALLENVADVPGLPALLAPLGRDRYPDLMDTADTRFDEIACTFAVAEQTVHCNDLRMATRDYAARGRASVHLDGTVDARGTLVGSERLTRDVVAGIAQARYLLDEEGRLVIPFRARGTWPRVRPVPDVDAVLTMLQRGGARALVDELREHTRKQKGKKPTDELIERALEGLLGR